MRQIFRVFFGIVWFAVLVLSLLPGEYLPPAFDWWDKAQHALAFFVLCGMGLLSYPATPTPVVAGMLVYGALIELAQSATGWRYGDWQDCLADAIGVGLAYLGWFFWNPLRSHGQISKP